MAAPDRDGSPPKGDAPASDVEALDGAGYTQDGVYRCCAPGTGTACCTDQKDGLCFEYGGLYKDCRKAGEVYEGKVICAHCCPGLSRMSLREPGNGVPASVDSLPEGCDETSAPPSLGICVNCGDGVCGPGENVCICREDCRPDAGEAGDAG